jgi:hypothetical protein
VVEEGILVVEAVGHAWFRIEFGAEGYQVGELPRPLTQGTQGFTG